MTWSRASNSWRGLTWNTHTDSRYGTFWLVYTTPGSFTGRFAFERSRFCGLRQLAFLKKLTAFGATCIHSKHLSSWSSVANPSCKWIWLSCLFADTLLNRLSFAHSRLLTTWSDIVSQVLCLFWKPFARSWLCTIGLAIFTTEPWVLWTLHIDIWKSEPWHSNICDGSADSRRNFVRSNYEMLQLHSFCRWKLYSRPNSVPSCFRPCWATYVFIRSRILCTFVAGISYTSLWKFSIFQELALLWTFSFDNWQLQAWTDHATFGFVRCWILCVASELW